MVYGFVSKFIVSNIVSYYKLVTQHPLDIYYYTINPRCACATRVTVVVSVCLSVCLSVYYSISHL